MRHQLKEYFPFIGNTVQPTSAFVQDYTHLFAMQLGFSMFTYISDLFGGVTPQRGDISTDQGRINWGISTRFRRRRGREKVLSTFFEIFGKVVNKYAIQSDFWGYLCKSISTIFDKSSFLAKKVFLQISKFSKVFLQRWGHPPPLNRSDRYCVAPHESR